MIFEFDENKSRSNQDKHGIDFLEAQKLWDDPDRVEIAVRTVDEPRCMIVGKIGPEHWSAGATYRDDRTRIIPVRR
jgi:uncharacterized protein